MGPRAAQGAAAVRDNSFIAVTLSAIRPSGQTPCRRRRRSHGTPLRYPALVLSLSYFANARIGACREPGGDRPAGDTAGPHDGGQGGGGVLRRGRGPALRPRGRPGGGD